MLKSRRTKKTILYGITRRIPIIPNSFTLAETQSFLSAHKSDFDTIDYIYTTDTAGKLTGAFSIKEMYQYPLTTPVNQVTAKSPLITAQRSSSPEEIAYLALKHGIKAVPILDENQKFLGIIPHDIINKFLYKELREDTLYLAGIHRKQTALAPVRDTWEIPLSRAVRHRLPWLIIGTLGGLFISKIIAHYEQTLQDNLILATFIPLVVYIADAVGTQLEAFVIRDFALFRKLDFARYFRKQLSIILSLALILGSGVILLGWALFHRFDIAWVLGLAIIGATISALFSGLIVPFLFRKMAVDPANASGPLGTIIQDASSVAIYFLIASSLL